MSLGIQGHCLQNLEGTLVPLEFYICISHKEVMRKRNIRVLWLILSFIFWRIILFFFPALCSLAKISSFTSGACHYLITHFQNSNRYLTSNLDGFSGCVIPVINNFVWKTRILVSLSPSSLVFIRNFDWICFHDSISKVITVTPLFWYLNWLNFRISCAHIYLLHVFRRRI